MTDATRMAPEPLGFEALEKIYETLAAGIDRAGEADEAVFLAKLVMILAHRAGAGIDFDDCVETAMLDLGLPAVVPRLAN